MDFDATLSENQIKTRNLEHQWVPVTEKTHVYWEERDCPVCGLHDMRVRNAEERTQTRGEWRVQTPCIEPVPERMTYEEFLGDLDRHGFSIDRRPHNLVPYVMGQPGNWQIGFKGPGQHRTIRLDPAILLKAPLEMDHGWALLLRWLRARDYRPWSYAEYGSTGVSDAELAPAPYSHEDD